MFPTDVWGVALSFLEDKRQLLLACKDWRWNILSNVNIYYRVDESEDLEKLMLCCVGEYFTSLSLNLGWSNVGEKVAR